MIEHSHAEFIFVGGCPRSGTTLVQNILNSHPDIMGGPEFLHVPDIINIRDKLIASIEKGWISKYCTKEEVDGAIRSLLERLILPLKYESGCRLLSEKTPENVLVFSQLLELYPEIKCIHVVRDPRAVVASMLQVGVRAKNKGINTKEFASDITVAMQFARKCLIEGIAAEKKYPNNILRVRYEDLVMNPENESRRICDFLGFMWSDQMLHPGSVKHLGEEAITKNSKELWYTRDKYYRDPVTDEIDKWKAKLSTLQKSMLNYYFGKNGDLDDLGYQFGDMEQSQIFTFIARALMRINNSRMFKRFGFRMPASVRELS